jgi:hypothetical protein
MSTSAAVLVEGLYSFAENAEEVQAAGTMNSMAKTCRAQK